MGDFEEILAEKPSNENPIKKGHKLIAARTTILPRIHLEIKDELQDGVEKLESEIGREAL